MHNVVPLHAPEETENEVAALEPASWLVLWGLRHWALCHRQEQSAWPMLNDLFGRNQVGAAAYSLNGLMQITALTTKRSLEVRCPACRKLSDDERLMLRAVCVAQKGNIEAARGILRDWLPETAVRMASHMVFGLADILADAGYELRPHAVRAGAWRPVDAVGGPQAGRAKLTTKPT